MSDLSQPRFHDETRAFEYLESIVWVDGITCPHCGVIGQRVYDLSGVDLSGVRGKPSKKGISSHQISRVLEIGYKAAFSIFKRGMKGVYQHCQKKHLHRNVADFEFRYNTRVALGFNDADARTRRCRASLASGSPMPD